MWFAQRRLDTLPRLRGTGKHRIEYRHIIDWLVRKPGAFANYRYRDELFPTTRFRVAYDTLHRRFTTARASKDYLRILQHAAQLSETKVDAALGVLVGAGEVPTLDAVEAALMKDEAIPSEDVQIAEVELSAYDELLDGRRGDGAMLADEKKLLSQNLRTLHLPTIRKCYEEQAKLAEQNTIPYPRYLHELVELEVEARRQNRVVRYLRESKFASREELGRVRAQATTAEG